MFLRVSFIFFTVLGLQSAPQISIFLIPPLQPEKSSLVYSQGIHKFSLCSATAYVSVIYIAGLLISFAYLQWN